MNRIKSNTQLKKTIFFILFSIIQYSSFAQSSKPNIIFILTDDQGYGDIGAHGNSLLKTPFLDQLYSESTCFTNFHSGTTCAPTRAGLLSGNYSNKVGAWHTIKGREMLSKDYITLTDVLKEKGYKTGIFGKWHLGDSYPFRPQDRGFQEVLILGGGGIGQTPDYWGNDHFDDTYFHNGKPKKFEGYCTDVWFENALKFINNSKDSPFFCYLPLNAPHSPYQVDPKYSSPYKDNKNIPSPNFYGMIANIDENIGKLRMELKRLGIEKNTILIFMTDNGASGGAVVDKDEHLISGYNAGMRGVKGSPYEGGHRVPFYINWPNGGIDKHHKINNLTSYVDFMPTILEFAGISKKIQSDGQSLVPLINNEAVIWKERTIVVDTQREEYLIKNKDACVMNDKWRLIISKNQNSLYNIEEDPSQLTDLGLKYPNIVTKLLADYNTWWDKTSINKDEYNRFIVGSKYQQRVSITSHDSHSEKSIPAWNQNFVRAGAKENGFYAINVAKSGKYIVELRRWPEESGLKINDASPATDKTPTGYSYPQGKTMNYVSAHLQVGDTKLELPVTAQHESVRFEVVLKKGDTQLIANFKDKNGLLNNAYYVYIEKSSQ
ncbi:arylsulfatase [Pedobacter glucosidilyticus]|nr:arylsulfatase [Pedobacter glucosidilyticus]KHJ39429.1 arylsulfatase [Pedobacter glucosidilyticus]